MDKKSLQKLEYDKITEMLSGYASSFAGRERCRKLKPMTSVLDIETAQEETSAAFSRILAKGRPSFTDCQPVSESLNRLKIGGVLGTGELLRICRLLTCVGHIKAYGRRENGDETRDCLDESFDALDPIHTLTSELNRCIISEDEISDEASSSLKQIRRRIVSQEEKVHTTLTDMVNGPARTYLQDPLVTMRQDRYCLPVKAEARSQVPGIIHDQSSTGSTLFIEPSAVVKLNNDLQELKGREQEEIQVILSRLSSLTAEYIDTIRSDYKLLTRLDFIFAKGALAIDMDSTRPDFPEKGRICIRQGRHPLLEKDSAVPISVSLGDAFDQLIITGPNTGGKTVTLKTVGLFTLMGQAGLFVPAKSGTELAVFTNVFADIGDEQSIEQSLSTFSSHMTNIVSFLKRVDTHSLVLLDELGAGTDPTEGAALATAILSSLHERGIFTMATTHYSELKVYAMTTTGVENACCEFDVASLRPTYHLRMGIPGESNAFAIASRLGMPDPVIADARARLSEQEESLEDLLRDLEESRRTLEAEQAEIETLTQQIEAQKAEAERQQEKLESQKEKILSDANEQALAILSDAKETADKTIRDFQKFGKENVSASEMEKERDQIRRKMDQSKKALEPAVKKPKKKYKESDFTPGEQVHVLSMNLTGTVTSPPDSNGMVTVQMGILKSRLPISDLEIVEETPSYLSKKPASSGRGGKIKMDKSMSVSPEINLLGKTVDEAVSALGKYLDDASLAHLKEVRIVHGKGTGALRSGVQQYLRTDRHVKSFRLGAMGEGDAGVTIAELK